MSQENHRVIRRMYSARNSGDVKALTGVLDPEVELRPTLEQQGLESLGLAD